MTDGWEVCRKPTRDDLIKIESGMPLDETLQGLHVTRTDGRIEAINILAPNTPSAHYTVDKDRIIQNVAPYPPMGDTIKITYPKETPMAPQIGDTVLYMSRGSKDGDFPPEPRAAIVTGNKRFGFDSTLSLYVITDKGCFHDTVAHDSDGEPGTWDYRPSDKTNAAPDREVTFERQTRLRILRDMRDLVLGFKNGYPHRDPLGALLEQVNRDIFTLEEAARADSKC